MKLLTIKEISEKMGPLRTHDPQALRRGTDPGSRAH